MSAPTAQAARAGNLILTGFLVRSGLDEAWQVARRGARLLHMADIPLCRHRFFQPVTPYPWDKDDGAQPHTPAGDLAAVRALIAGGECFRRGTAPASGN